MFARLLFLVHVVQCADLCPMEYRSIDPNHSFCSAPFPDVVEQPATASDRDHIVYMHNRERQRTHGTNLEKMYWSDELAEIALGHARTCMFEHDKPNQRIVPRIPLSTGQNLAMGYDNWTEAIEGWIEEKEHYYHAYPSTNVFIRYTQIVWHSSALVGCAAAMCPPYGSYNISWPFYVCNYVVEMVNSNYRAAFRRGLPSHPLHDCGGKVCLYNGTLDLQTCECQCSTYATGAYCEKLNCSVLPRCPYHSSVSCIAVDVPLECPRLCGLCDRYDMLKRVYGEENLAPNSPRMLSTTITSDTESSPEDVELSTETDFFATLETTMAFSVSAAVRVPSHMLFYLCINYVFVV